MTAKKAVRQEKRESMLSSSDWRKSLQVELRRVRSLVKEIAANYVSKLEGRAEDIARVLDEVELGSKDDFQRLIKRFRELNVKAHKGRRKDMRQLECVIDDMRVDLDALREKQEKLERTRPAVAAEKPGKRPQSVRRPRSASRSKVVDLPAPDRNSGVEIGSEQSSSSAVPA